jgi:membrane protease YdiL (CAAX protease family)
MILLKRFTQELRQRVNAPENTLIPWNATLPFGLLIMYLIVFFASLVFISTLEEVDFDAAEPRILAYAALMSSLLMLVFTVQYTENSLARWNSLQKKKLRYREVVALTPSQNTPLWGILLGSFSLAIALDVVGFIIGVPDTSLPIPLDGLHPDDGLPFLAAVLAIALIRPFVEGLIFYGVLYPANIKRMSHVQAILFSAMLFAILHYILDTREWWGFVVPLVLGLTAGIVRAATQSSQTAIGTCMMFGIFAALRALIV